MGWWRSSGGDPCGDGPDDEFARDRNALMAEIAAEAACTAEWTGRPHFDARVMAAMAAVPRDEFVPSEARVQAWINRPLPIGYRQTISQPYIVALMTDLVAPRPDHVVLEVGTGSGYQAAVLARLVRQVYSIELVPELAQSAAERLKRLGYDNVEVRASDGARGWPEHAPFDGIMVTAAADAVPPALVEQLRPGGRLVIPVGGGGGQQLQVVQRTGDGGSETRTVLPVSFVPLRERPEE
jgi:protein-L-isoaspartate(D-aspartate) O-methyltransferase